MPLNLKKLRILIAEDCKPMQDLLADMLDTLGCGRIYRAMDGEQAFQIFAKERPDIVITDWLMKPVDGLELTQMIRKSADSSNRFLPVIMLSGYSSYNRVMKARDSGITEFLVKPFTAADISKRIVHVVNHPRDFIYTSDFFGPDRRRRADPNFEGPYRREADQD